jgi:hypothetical protein
LRRTAEVPEIHNMGTIVEGYVGVPFRQQRSATTNASTLAASRRLPFPEPPFSDWFFNAVELYRVPVSPSTFSTTSFAPDAEPASRQVAWTPDKAAEGRLRRPPPPFARDRRVRRSGPCMGAQEHLGPRSRSANWSRLRTRAIVLLIDGNRSSQCPMAHPRSSADVRYRRCAETLGGWRRPTCVSSSAAWRARPSIRWRDGARTRSCA